MKNFKENNDSHEIKANRTMAFVTAQGNKAELPDGPHSHLPSVLWPQHKCQELGEKRKPAVISSVTFIPMA